MTTDWLPATTAPADYSVIEIRYLHGHEIWGFSCRRGADGVFIDLEGRPLHKTPDEWRPEQF